MAVVERDIKRISLKQRIFFIIQ